MTKEPYVLQHTAEAIDHKLELIDVNKNLLPYPYDGSNEGIKKYNNFLEDVGDGSILISNTTTEEITVYLGDVVLPIDADYFSSVTVTDLYDNIIDLPGCELSMTEGAVDGNEQAYVVSLVIPADTEKGLLIKPQIEFGTEKTDWVPNMDKIGIYVDRRFNSTNTKLRVLADDILNKSEKPNVLPASSGLAYVVVPTDETYGPHAICTGLGTCTSTDIIIADTYDGKPVISIGDEAFKDIKTLKSVILPNSITAINKHAFNGCSALKSINIPENVSWIGHSAFYKCSVLENVVLPKKITKLSPNSFAYCKRLKSIEIPSKVTEIGEGAFDSCTGLTSVLIPNSVETVGKNVFWKCKNLTVYCQAVKKPANWDSDWTGATASGVPVAVVWGAGFVVVNQTSSNVALTELLDTNVKLSEDIWTDKTIGHINATTTSPKKVASKDDTLKTMFTNIFGTVVDDTSNLVTTPYISSVTIGNPFYEYGTKLNTVFVTIVPKAGKYTYGPAVEGAGWNGKYTLSGTGFTTKSDSTNDTQPVSLSSTFTVGTSSSLTLTASRAYNAATNTAKSKMGADTTQTIAAGTATKNGTFNPEAKKYVYYAVTSSTTTPTSWTRYGTGTTIASDLSITADAGQYIWIAATDNCEGIKEINELSGEYNAVMATTKLSNQKITNSQNAEVDNYCIYRNTEPRSGSGTSKFALGNN